MLGIPRLYAFIGIGVGALVLVGLLWWAIASYGARQYQAGVDATDAKWEEASRRLQEQAAQSATRADDNAAKRLEEFQTQVQEEQEAIDAATQNGSSVFDVMFGS